MLTADAGWPVWRTAAAATRRGTRQRIPDSSAAAIPSTRGDLTTLWLEITSDDSGITHYDAAFFREVMRTGKARGRELSPLMPWIVFRNLNDHDLDALFAYLRALPKVKHVIDNIDKPTKCAICGGEHPLGQYNRPRELKLVSVPLDELKDTLGTYRFEDGFQVRHRDRRRQVHGEVRRRAAASS